MRLTEKRMKLTEKRLTKAEKERDFERTQNEKHLTKITELTNQLAALRLSDFM